MSDEWAKRQEDNDMKLHLQSLLNNAESDGNPLRWFEDLYDAPMVIPHKFHGQGWK